MAHNVENLIPANKRTKEERKRLGSMGGKQSAINNRKRKTLKEELLLLLEQGDTQQKISLALLQKAMNGDVKAFECIRDSIGEKCKEEVELSTNTVEINITT